MKDFELTLDDAIRLLRQKLIEQDAEIADVFAMCALLPSLLELIKSLPAREITKQSLSQIKEKGGPQG